MRFMLLGSGVLKTCSKLKLNFSFSTITIVSAFLLTIVTIVTHFSKQNIIAARNDTLIIKPLPKTPTKTFGKH